MKHEIDLIFTPDGEVTLQVKGAKGKKCIKLTKELEEELGLIIEREKTSEYYEEEEVVEEVENIKVKRK